MNEEVNYLIYNPISFLTNLCAPVACAPMLSLAIFVEKKHPLVSVESLLHKKNEEVNGKVYCWEPVNESVIACEGQLIVDRF